MTTYSLARDVILMPLADGSARLLDLGGQFYALPAIGAVMLTETLAHGPAAAVARITREYNAEARKVETDLNALLREFESRGLLRRCTNEPVRPATSRFAYLFVVVVLGALRCVPSLTIKAWAHLALARTCFVLFGWVRTVAAWQRYHRSFPGRSAGPDDEATVRAVDRAVRGAAARHLLQVACKERGLCCWALARSAGLAANVVVGIHLFPLSGHCWCEVGPWALSDDSERCEEYQPVIRYA